MIEQTYQKQVVGVFVRRIPGPKTADKILVCIGSGWPKPQIRSPIIRIQNHNDINDTIETKTCLSCENQFLVFISFFLFLYNVYAFTQSQRLVKYLPILVPLIAWYKPKMTSDVWHKTHRFVVQSLVLRYCRLRFSNQLTNLSKHV